MHPLRALDHYLDQLSPAMIVVGALLGVILVGGIDFLTGYTVSVSLFYLAPVALAAWYAGRKPGVAFAVFSCLSWYIADMAAGHVYAHPLIPVWNALVRFGFFLITALLLARLRDNLREQQRLARTDSLTGLYGRRTFDDRLEHDLALAQRRGSALTLAYVDLDDFKMINDTHGHTVGDQVLKVVGGILLDSAREVDTAARLGGDEFALILPDTDGVGAQRIISRLRDELLVAFGADVKATCSIGVVTFQQPEMRSGDLIAEADTLMYEVKKKNKGAALFKVIGETA